MLNHYTATAECDKVSFIIYHQAEIFLLDLQIQFNEAYSSLSRRKCLFVGAG